MARFAFVLFLTWLLMSQARADNSTLWFQRDTTHGHDIWVAHLGQRAIWTENAAGRSHFYAPTGITILECLDYLLLVDSKGTRLRKLNTTATLDPRVVLLHNGILTYTVGTQVIGVASLAESNAGQLIAYLRSARLVRGYDLRSNKPLAEHREVEYGLPLTYFRSNLVCLKIRNLREALAHHNRKVGFDLVLRNSVTGRTNGHASLRLSWRKSRSLLQDVLGSEPFDVPTVSVARHQATIANLFGSRVRANIARDRVRLR